MLSAILQMILLTFVPGLELRASIPWGIFGTDVPWWTVFLVCIVANIAVGWCVFSLLGPFCRLLRRWAWFDRRIWPWVESRQDKLRPYVDKYGEWGVALFIGVPLPGTGVFTGSLGAFLLKLDRRKFLVANVAGVLIAGVAVLLLCLLIDRGIVGQDSVWARMFMKDRPAAAETELSEPSHLSNR